MFVMYLFRMHRYIGSIPGSTDIRVGNWYSFLANKAAGNTSGRSYSAVSYLIAHLATPAVQNRTDGRYLMKMMYFT